MMIDSKSKIDINKKTNELKPFWNNKLRDGEYFRAKVTYKPSTHDEPLFRMFKSELEKGDVYIELLNIKSGFYYPNKRILFKLPYNPNYDSTYENVEGQSENYMIPLSFLIKVDEREGSIYFKDESETLPLVSNMNAQDLYAVIHKQPVSKNENINNMIRRFSI